MNAKWEKIIKENHSGYCDVFTDFSDLVREVPMEDEDLEFFESVVDEARKGQGEYDSFPDEGGIDIAAALLAEVRRSRENG